MSIEPLNTVVREVLGQFGLSNLAAEPFGNRGGFSGAAIWRVPQPGGDLCLRAWPAGEMDRQRITHIHSLMNVARDNGLSFVPNVLTARTGSTTIIQADRLWDLCTWMSGTAAVPGQVSRGQVEAAFTALALLHQAWAAIAPSRGLCAGVIRRLEAYRDWELRIRTSWLEFAPDDPAQKWAERAWRLLKIHAGKIRSKLRSWLGHDMPLQPCLCDIWHDHVLFDGDVVTGLVDYGGVKTDHLAVDLARLLGSLVEDRADLRDAGLQAYSRLRSLSLQEEELVSVLDETGALVGLITWLKWLYFEGKEFDDRRAAARRLQTLVERVEEWKL